MLVMIDYNGIADKVDDGAMPIGYPLLLRGTQGETGSRYA